MSNSSPPNPVGIFDSGIGGLTVAHAISKLLPNEEILYFGDTAHLPYGDKSEHAIRSYADRITEFLISRDCKAVIIACNTASAHAYEHLKAKLSDQLLVINVIDPVIEYLKIKANAGKIGVIGTKGTIRSGIYESKLKAVLSDTEVVSLETGLLAFMIEEGFINSDLSRSVIKEYLSNPILDGIDTLILGCTHYPLIKKEIEEYYGGSVNVIDSASVVAEHFKNVLEQKNLSNNGPAVDPHFYVSDHSSFFEQTANVFFQAPVHLELYRIWEEGQSS